MFWSGSAIPIRRRWRRRNRWRANPDALKPLDGFADKGVPNPATSAANCWRWCRNCRRRRRTRPPPAPAWSTACEAGAAKLVRIERTDAVGNSSGNVVARVTAAALRNDYQEARRELNALPPADRAAAQGWIEKADARDAALSVSRQFASQAMAALAKPIQ